MNAKIRVLVAKPGLDGHDRGAKVVARALRDAGMEVIYTGIRQTPEMIVEAALQEDVDVVGLSVLSGAHLVLLPLIAAQLRAADLAEVLIVAGGIIPEADIEPLKQAGIHAIFTPGTSMHDIVTFITEHVATPSPLPLSHRVRGINSLSSGVRAGVRGINALSSGVRAGVRGINALSGGEGGGEGLHYS